MLSNAEWIGLLALTSSYHVLASHLQRAVYIMSFYGWYRVFLGLTMKWNADPSKHQFKVFISKTLEFLPIYLFTFKFMQENWFVYVWDSPWSKSICANYPRLCLFLKLEREIVVCVIWDSFLQLQKKKISPEVRIMRFILGKEAWQNWNAWRFLVVCCDWNVKEWINKLGCPRQIFFIKIATLSILQNVP